MYIQGIWGVYVGLYRTNFMAGMPKEKWYFTGKSRADVIEQMLRSV